MCFLAITLADFSTAMSGNGAILATIILLLGLVEIVPIKINPLSSLMKWIGNKCNQELAEKVQNLDTQMNEFTKDFNKYKRSQELKMANDMRWDILNFANSCRNKVGHDKEEWNHVLSQLNAYERFVNEHDIDNAVIEEDTRYLRELYRENLAKNSFMNIER